MKKVICLFACLLNLNVSGMNECSSPRVFALSIIATSKSMDFFQNGCLEDCPVINTPVKKDKSIYSGGPECDCPVSPVKKKSPVSVTYSSRYIMAPEGDCIVVNTPPARKTPPVKDDLFLGSSPTSIVDDLKLYSFQLQNKKQ